MLSARLSSKPPSTASAGHIPGRRAPIPGLHPAAARRGALRSSRSHVVEVVAFKGQVGERLLKNAQRYAEVTGGAGLMTRGEVEDALRPMVGTGIEFESDGIVYPYGRTRSLPELVDSLERQHRAYEHLTYKPMFSAVNEEEGVVFSAILYVLRNREPVLGASAPTQRLSKGLLIDKLTFDKATGQIISSLVARQMTLEERDALLKDPTRWNPVVVEDKDLTAVPNVVAGPADEKFMMDQIRKWVSVWDSDASLDCLSGLMDPACRCLDGYGLRGKAGGLLWQGIDGARAAVASAHEKLANSNELVSLAVSDKHKLGFHHWRAHAVSKANGRAVPMEGVGLILFNSHLQVKDVYEFIMARDDNLAHQQAQK